MLGEDIYVQVVAGVEMERRVKGVVIWEAEVEQRVVLVEDVLLHDGAQPCPPLPSSPHCQDRGTWTLSALHLATLGEGGVHTLH